jgi:hypothetical protein
MEFPLLWRDNKPPPSSPAAAKPTRPPAAVIPDQVMEANAAAQADALEQEIAWDEQNDMTSARSKRPKSEKP